MKTIDHVKQYLKEWPEECTYICVDDDGKIWLSKNDSRSARYTDVGWVSAWYDSIGGRPEEELEDNDKIITKYDWDRAFQPAWSMDKFNEQLKALLREAGMNGVAVERIEASYDDVGTMAEGEKYLLMDVSVEYKY